MKMTNSSHQPIVGMALSKVHQPRRIIYFANLIRRVHKASLPISSSTREYIQHSANSTLLQVQQKPDTPERVGLSPPTRYDAVPDHFQR
ncbi:MAG: hypothetical protein K0R08_2026 [Solimicrobium sp.]|nr:hypothetical protein [Solimicrobium sp.]